MKLLLTWLISTLAFLVSAWLIPGAKIESFWAAVIASLVLGVVNAIIRPILVVLTLPINLLTLGLFTLIINGLMIWLVSALLAGFSITGFWVAVLFSIILAVVVWLMEAIIK